MRLPLPAKKKSAEVTINQAETTSPSTDPGATELTKPTVLPADPRKRVFLIDAMSFIFRAYHAMVRQRPMSTKTGIPTAATYVFVNMLNKLRQDFSPEYLAAVFDLAGPTFRDTQAKALTSIRKFDIKTQTFTEVKYHGYKANRSEMPHDLAQQVPYIRRALEAYRIPILSHEGFEADDVIGTLARQAAEQGNHVFVVSNDKDMLQLVGENVCVLNPPKDNLICDAAKVEEILGVPPRQVVDVMALRGDSIDNIPGAPGIGDKGSVELIRRFGSVENALDHASEIEKKSYRESLENNRDVVLLSKELVTIDQNVPVTLDLVEMLAQPPDVDACRALFSELEFTTLLKSVVPDAPAALAETHYEELSSDRDLESVLAAAKKTWLAIAFTTPELKTKKTSTADEEADEITVDGVDLQSTTMAKSVPQTGSLFENVALSESLGTSAPREAGLSSEGGKAYLIRIAGERQNRLQAVLADESVAKAIHDYKSALRNVFPDETGASLAGVQHDTMLYSYLLDPTLTNHSLANLALRRFNLQLSDSLPQAADLTYQLVSALRHQVEAEQLLPVYNQIDLPLVPVLARMEAAGVKIDLEVLKELSDRLGRECDAKAKQIHELAGLEFNINSPKQLGDVLFNRMNLPKPLKYGKGKAISTAVDVLEDLAKTHEVPRLVLDYRQMSKLKSTYVDALPVLINPRTGRLHTTFNQTGTATGRLSSINPNLQNIPIRTQQGREIRAAFTADEGHVLLAADYSQIELRLLAHYSEDSLLIQAFRNGEDIHSLTAAEVFGVPPMMINAEHRRRAKAVNFGIVYGLSPFGLSQQLGIETKEAKTYIDNYFARYTGVRQFIDRTLEQTRREGLVRTMFGRVRPIPDINSANANMRGFAERTAVNTPLQGTAADLIKIAMLRIDEEIRRRKMKTRMTLQVHDELVFEVPEAELEETRKLVCDQMENVHSLRVPLMVECLVGKNWRDME